MVRLTPHNHSAFNQPAPAPASSPNKAGGASRSKMGAKAPATEMNHPPSLNMGKYRANRTPAGQRVGPKMWDRPVVLDPACPYCDAPAVSSDAAGALAFRGWVC